MRKGLKWCKEAIKYKLCKVPLLLSFCWWGCKGLQIQMTCPSSKISEWGHKAKTNSKDYIINQVTLYFYFLLFYALNAFIRKKINAILFF